MNICGILVHITPEDEAAVRERLGTIPGVEVHAVSPEGRMVTTLEDTEEESTADKMFSIQDVEGVLSASMIYHHSEDSPDSIVDEPPVCENEDLGLSRH